MSEPAPSPPTLGEFIERLWSINGYEVLTCEFPFSGDPTENQTRYARRQGNSSPVVLPNVPENIPLTETVFASLCHALNLDPVTILPL